MVNDDTTDVSPQGYNDIQKLDVKLPPTKKQRKLLERQARLEAELSNVALELQREDEKEMEKQMKNPQKYAKKLEKAKRQQREILEWQIEQEQNKGKDAIHAGQAMMIIGTIISILGFLAGGGWATFIVGLMLQIPGIALYQHGKKQRGEGSTVFFGGFGRW